MWFFWLIALFIIGTGAYLWIRYNQVHWGEWLTSSLVALALAGLFQWIAVVSMTSDVETWSGRITTVHFQPAWLEYYEEAEYRTEFYTEEVSSTDSKGNTTYSTELRSRQVFDHWEPCQRQHPDAWDKGDDLGQSWGISQAEYGDLLSKFGREVSQAGQRYTSEHESRMIGGDPLDYYAQNVNDFLVPTNMTRKWENRVKAAPSKFTFRKVPKDIKVFPYPANSNPFVSDRVMGEATQAVSIAAWDAVNSRLGFSKKVNLILIGFGSQDRSIAEWQKDAFLSGKKNDIIVAYGTGIAEDGISDPKAPTWVSVFGWSDSEHCKRQIESLLLSKGISDEVLPALEEEVRANYQIKNWHEFDYVKVEPPLWSYWTFLGTMLLVQGGFWLWAFLNDAEKDTNVWKSAPTSVRFLRFYR